MSREDTDHAGTKRLNFTEAVSFSLGWDLFSEEDLEGHMVPHEIRNRASTPFSFGEREMLCQYEKGPVFTKLVCSTGCVALVFEGEIGNHMVPCNFTHVA